LAEDVIAIISSFVFVSVKVRIVVPGHVVVSLLKSFLSFYPIVTEVIYVNIRTVHNTRVVEIVVGSISNLGEIVCILAVISKRSVGFQVL
jgi:hypothetical protein